MKHCQNCGTQLEDSAKFCPNCGAKIPGLDAAHPSEASRPSAPAAPAPAGEPAATVKEKKRFGIAAQVANIAAGKKTESSRLTYFYGFFQLLYHKSYRLFCRTYLPACLLFCLDIGFWAYAVSVPSSIIASAASLVLLLAAAIWFVVVSFWLSRRYPQELYKQVHGDADRIPSGLLAPVLGGFALVALAILALFIGLGVGILFSEEPASSGIGEEPALVEQQQEEPAEEVPAGDEPSEPDPDAAEGSSSMPDLTNAVPTDGYWLAPADQPWLGAWYADDGFSLMVFEQSSEYLDYQSEATGDGGYRIYCSDPRDGIVSQIFELSPDQATLTEMDANGNFVRTYQRPQYSDAYSPLPQEFWGFYTHVEGDSYLAQHVGPQENFVVDAFRFGNCMYQELTDNGDGTFTFYILMAPEGGYVTIGLGSYEDSPAIAIYDNAGTSTDVYVRTE